MSSRFFYPFVGSNYQKGIQGKKVLILGASFYCPQTDCKFFNICTDVEKKDSSPCDKTCPVYMSDGKTLHDEPTYCIGDAPRTYQTFAGYISKFIGTEEYDTVWSHLAKRFRVFYTNCKRNPARYCNTLGVCHQFKIKGR